MRRKWSGQEVPSAASRRRRDGVHEVQHLRLSSKWPTLRSCFEIRPRIERHQPRDGPRAPPPAVPKPRAAEGRLRVVWLEPVLRLLDDAQRRLVAGPRRRPPGEQAVTAQHDADAWGLSLAIRPSLSPRSKPGRCHGRQPISSPKISSISSRGIRRGSDGDHRVGVHVIDVAMRHEAVQRRVDGGGAGVEVERAVRRAARPSRPRARDRGRASSGARACRGTGSRSRPASSSRCRRPSP